MRLVYIQLVAMEELPLTVAIILQISAIWFIQWFATEIFSSISTQFNSFIRSYILKLEIMKTESFFFVQ